VIEQDVMIEDGEVALFRSKVRLSFKHDTDAD
jgi:flavin-binding protein dodecin